MHARINEGPKHNRRRQAERNQRIQQRLCNAAREGQSEFPPRVSYHPSTCLLPPFSGVTRQSVMLRCQAFCGVASPDKSKIWRDHRLLCSHNRVQAQPMLIDKPTYARSGLIAHALCRVEGNSSGWWLPSPTKQSPVNLLIAGLPSVSSETRTRRISRSNAGPNTLTPTSPSSTCPRRALAEARREEFGLCKQLHFYPNFGFWRAECWSVCRLEPRGLHRRAFVCLEACVRACVLSVCGDDRPHARSPSFLSRGKTEPRLRGHFRRGPFAFAPCMENGNSSRTSELRISMLSDFC